MTIREIIQGSYLIAVANISLLIFILFNSTLPKAKRASFLLASIICIIMLICNMIQYRFDGTTDHLLLLRINNAVSFSVSGPVILPFLFLSSVIPKRIRIMIQVLAGINIILCFLSIGTNWIFRYDAEGHMHFGKLSPLPYILSLMYISLLVAASYRKFRLGFRSEGIFLTALCVFIIAAIVMNTVYHYQYLISGMATLSSIFYYMFFATQTLTKDALTGALNRHSFYKDIEMMKKRQMYLVSLDLNGLKQINDTYGHNAGDHAILAVSESAMETLPARCRFYRMGGDEFEIFCPGMDAEEVEHLVTKLQLAVKARGYSTAVGWGEYKKGMDFDEVFRDVDQIMYRNKAQMKHQAAAQKAAEKPE